MEEKKNKSTGKTITIIILIILLLGTSGYIAYDKLINKPEQKETKEETKTKQQEEDLVTQIKFNLEDFKCVGTETCEKKMKLAYNNKNHELKLIKKLTDDTKNYKIEVYEDNKLIDTLDGGSSEDFWQEGRQPLDNIKNMDGYVYVIDGKYLGIVYRHEGAKPSWYLKFYNGDKPSQEKPIMVAAYGTSFSSESYEDGKQLYVLSALEFDGTTIKYWDMDCSSKQKPTGDGNTIVAQYSLKFDGKKVTKTKGKVLTDAQGGGQAGPCTNE